MPYLLEPLPSVVRCCLFASIRFSRTGYVDTRRGALPGYGVVSFRVGPGQRSTVGHVGGRRCASPRHWHQQDWKRWGEQVR